MCIDYRALNKVTVKNKYPTLIVDFFDQLGEQGTSPKTTFARAILKCGSQKEPKTTEVWFLCCLLASLRLQLHSAHS